MAASHADETKKETALQITSTAENSTKDWTAAYAYIEDIRDGRGYTGGLVGFTTATSDMLHLVRQYVAEQPGSTLALYLSGLEACADRGETVDDAGYGVYGGGASDIAARRLGPPFLAAWADAANHDPVFRRCSGICATRCIGRLRSPRLRQTASGCSGLRCTTTPR